MNKCTPDLVGFSLERVIRGVTGIAMIIIGSGSFVAGVSGGIVFSATPLIIAIGIGSLATIALGVYLLFANLKFYSRSDIQYLQTSPYYQSMFEALKGDYSKAVELIRSRFTDSKGNISTDYFHKTFESSIHNDDACFPQALRTVYGSSMFLLLRQQILEGKLDLNENSNDRLAFDNQFSLVKNAFSIDSRGGNHKDVWLNNLEKALNGDKTSLVGMNVPSLNDNIDDFEIVGGSRWWLPA